MQWSDSLIHLVFHIYPFKQTFIECIYKQHFLYHTAFTHCRHSCQRQFRVEYHAQGNFVTRNFEYWDETAGLLFGGRPALVSLVALNEKYQRGWECVCGVMVVKGLKLLLFIHFSCLSKTTTGMSERKPRRMLTCGSACTVAQSWEECWVRNAGSTTSGPQMSLWPTKWRQEGYRGKNRLLNFDFVAFIHFVLCCWHNKNAW